MSKIKSSPVVASENVSAAREPVKSPRLRTACERGGSIHFAVLT
jgi:hypothetical protein